jgi:phospholipase/carboxylesterase
MTTPLRDVRSPGWATEPTPVVAVLLHGYGSNEHDLAGLAPAIGLELPWASLRAPIELGNGGAAWFEITTPGDPDAAPVEASTEAIWAWVDEAAGPDATVVPVGFSQGGLMASQLLRSRPERVLAPVILGGFVLGHPQPGDDALAAGRPAAFWGRGEVDRVIGPPAIARTGAYLPGHTTLTERVYPGLAHGIDGAEVADVRAFLAANVGPHAVTTR